MASRTFLDDLEEFGYAVIPNVLTEAQVNDFKERVWLEVIEKMWPDCKFRDPGTWGEHFPQFNRNGIFAGKMGQSQVAWDLRQIPAIADIWAKIWKCSLQDLVVSMDGFNMMSPIGKTYVDMNPHTDQGSENPKFHTVQGQILLEDSFEGEAGFYCIPRSHHHFAETAPIIQSLDRSERPNYIGERFGFQAKKHITASKGSVIIWDSRTIHGNQIARRPMDHPRMVFYVCYVPKERLTPTAIQKRKEAYENTSTGHDPIAVELKYAQFPHIAPEFEHYVTAGEYIQPIIQLSDLGLSLRGF